MVGLMYGEGLTKVCCTLLKLSTSCDAAMEQIAPRGKLCLLVVSISTNIVAEVGR